MESGTYERLTEARIERDGVESSNLKSVGWADDILEVEFKNGTVYRYADVSRGTFEELRDASSVGRAFNTLVVKENFPYRKM